MSMYFEHDHVRLRNAFQKHIHLFNLNKNILNFMVIWLKQLFLLMCYWARSWGHWSVCYCI